MIVLVLLLFVSSPACGETVPDWFIPLREAVYGQTDKADKIYPLYKTASDSARSSLSGANLYVMLSRCENMIGLAYRDEERKEEAAFHFEEGITFAEKALELVKSAEAWQLLAENISQSCAVRSASYAMANGLKVEKYAKNALALNSRNSASQYLIAARWVFAPSPFHNYRKGIEMMTAILTESDMDKDDLFRAYSAIGYAYVQQKKYNDARPWLLKSLEVYPSNDFVKSLLAKS